MSQVVVSPGRQGPLHCEGHRTFRWRRGQPASVAAGSRENVLLLLVVVVVFFVFFFFTIFLPLSVFCHVKPVQKNLIGWGRAIGSAVFV